MGQQAQWEVYIIQTKSGNLYTGITTDLDRRFEEHRNGKRGAKYFNVSDPDKIVFREHHPDRSQATRREREIKQMSRPQKLALIAGDQPD